MKIEITKENIQPNIAISYNHSDPVLADRIKIELSLEYLTSNEMGSILIRGFLEEVKIELLEVIRLKKIKNRGNGKIIIPSMH